MKSVSSGHDNTVKKTEKMKNYFESGKKPIQYYNGKNQIIKS